MIRMHFRRNAHSARVRAIAMLALLAALIYAPAPARGAEKYGNSLDLVPADAAFYSTSLRMKEQVDIVAQSKAWDKLQSIASVQMARQMIEAQLNQPGAPGAMFMQMLQLPENQQLIQLLGDMGSHEMFVYGDATFPGFVRLYGILQRANQQEAIATAITFPGGIAGRKPGWSVINTLADHLDLVRVPNLVLGFKINKTEPAETQLKRLEVVANMFLQQKPELLPRLKRQKVGDAEFVTFTLDGDLVPWGEIEPKIREVEEKPGQYDKLLAKLKSLKLVIALGVRKGYALVSIGDSTDAISKLGSSASLGERPEFAKFAPYKDKRVTTVSYISPDMAAAIGFGPDDVDAYNKAVTGGLADSPLPPELRERIAKDVDRLAGQLKAVLPKSGAQLAFGFLTDHGTEGYGYDWSEHRGLDDSKQLGILNHVGGNPLVAIAGRSKYRPEGYQTLVEWLGVGYHYFEDFAVPQMKPDEQKQYREIVEFARPLVQRLDAATREHIIPALADSQGAFVLDAKVTSRQWHKDMPRSTGPLPMFEPALVIGVSDADHLKKGIAEYWSIAEAVVEKVKELNPHDVPPGFKLPAPKTRDVEGGTVYYFAVPKEAGLDGQLSPNAGLGEHVAVLSLVPKQTARLLKPTPLVASSNWPESAKPLALAGYLDWPGLVDAATPWVEYGVRKYGAEAMKHAGIGLLAIGDDAKRQLQEADEESPQTQFILDQVREYAEILKTLRTITTSVRVEDSVTVTHVESVWKDLE